MTVSGVGWAGPVGPKPPARRPGATFRMPDADTTDEAAATVSVSATTMPSLLAMQERGSDLVGDREARRHGDAMLEQLRAIQVALLGGAYPGRSNLAALVRTMPEAADPGLVAVQRALRVRVAVELARERTALSK